MQITRDYLLQRKAEMESIITLHRGAIEMLDHLLGLLDEEESEMTVNDLAEAIGGHGASATILPVENENAL